MKKSNRIVCSVDDSTQETLNGISELTGTSMTTLINNAIDSFLFNNQDLARKALTYMRKKNALQAELISDDNTENNATDNVETV